MLQKLKAGHCRNMVFHDQAAIVPGLNSARKSAAEA
jgi:hypothetical protein